MSANGLYLFRYRNLLTADTLGEHRKIIDEYAYCWWGWWQRPAEDPQNEIWEDLQKRTKSGEAVEIGLFDSEPGREGPVHFATLTGLKPPERDRAPSLPLDELEKVPSYYRDAPFSSAWMRLTAIDPEPTAPEKFFRRYSFARAPRLRGITEDDRKRYTDKLILDAEELRSMDTTIWEVRSKVKGDHEERILTASSKVTEALSSHPIELRSSRILHISDLHFTTSEFKPDEHNWDLIGQGKQTLHARIVDALKSGPRVGLIVISGDLTYWASNAEFYEAFRFVHALLGALQLGPEHLIVVPGNHDLMWTKPEDKGWVDGEKVSEAPADAQRSYRTTFYERVFRHAAASHLGMARRFVCPNGLTLEIGGLNSSGLEHGKNWLVSMGRVADGAFAEVATALGWDPKAPSMALRMLVHHHHVTPTEDILPLNEFERGFGMASDAKRTLREAARHGVQLILHGHRHQPFIGAEQVYAELESVESRWELGRVGIIGAASAGSTAVKDGANGFNVIDIHPAQLELTMFRAESKEGSRGGFRQVHCWSAELQRGESGKLAIGDWKRKHE